MKLVLEAGRHATPMAEKAGWFATHLLDFLYELSAANGLDGVIPRQFQDPDFLFKRWGIPEQFAATSPTITAALDRLVELGMVVRQEQNLVLLDWSEIAMRLTPARRLRKIPLKGDLGGGVGSSSSLDTYPILDTETDREDVENKNLSVSRLKDFWNASVPPEIPKLYKISGDRERHTRARLGEHTPEEWKAVIEELWACPFLRGDNDRKWTASFDWVLVPGNIAKVLEKKYRGIGQKERQQAKLALVGAVVAKPDEDLYS